MVYSHKRNKHIVSSLPNIGSHGNIEKAFSGIKAAAVPERLSQDFVKTVLKIPGGSGDEMTRFLKRLNFAGSDGLPTEVYTKFRNPTTSRQALAEAIKHAYAKLYVRNEYMHDLSESDLHGLIVEETGQAHDSLSVKRTLACILALKKHADFEKPIEVQTVPVDDTERAEASQPTPNIATPPQSSSGVGLNLGYTINLNLPATENPAVFNAIFKSLKEHLLRDDDA